jgi:uncharacterized protein (DUF736 family)
MAFEAKPNTGALFANTVKKHEKAPDYRGDFLLDIRSLEVKDNMVTIKLSGWKKTSSKGSTFLSLSLDTYKPKTESVAISEMEDDIPF